MKRILLTLLGLCLSCTLMASATAQRAKHHAYAKAANHWFLSVGGGMDYPHLNANSRVNNGSGFPAPGNQDIYSYQNNHHPFFTFAGGYRFNRDRFWFPSLSLGLTYQYLPSNDLGGKIMQFSDPSFLNYNFKIGVSASILLAVAKFNFLATQGFSPYVSAGAGAAYVRTGSYGETALPNVTPRTSAGYAENTNTQFAYALGAGLDYQLNQRFILSGGYQYLSLGRLNTGSGAGSWAGQSLNLGYYRSNELLVTLTYLLRA